MNIKIFPEAKSFRVFFIAIALVLVIFIILTLLINPLLNSFVKPKIISSINSPSLKVHIDDLSYSLFTNNLSVNNLQVINQSEKDSTQIRVKDINLGINWFHYVFKDGYRFSDVEINNIFINQVSKPSAIESKESKNTGVFSFLDSLSETAGYLSASALKVNNGYFTNKNIASGLTDSLKIISLTLDNLLLDTTIEKNQSLKIAENIEANIERGLFYFNDIKYKLSFRNLIISSFDQVLKLKDLSFRPYLNDEAYFKTVQFRADRFIFESPSLTIEGLDYPRLINNDIIKAENISLGRIRFDALTNMRLPVDPNAAMPEMPNVVLNETPFKFDIKQIKISNGNIFVKEIYPYDNNPGILQFGNLYITISNFKNNENVSFNIKTKLTGSGDLTLKFNLSLAPGAQKFNYSGRLGRMAATDLNKFIVVADRVQVMSGNIEYVDFNVEAKGDTAIAFASPIYSDLSIRELDEETGKSTGLIEKFNSFIANTFIIKENNLADDDPKNSRITYIREPDKAFLEYVWIALRAAVGDVVGFE